jgi:hypothetical protein
MTQQFMDSSAPEPQGPPLPKWAYRVMNPLMMGLLRSPLHGLMDQSLMILIFKGRKSGKRYQIPVGYLPDNGRLYLFSHSAWANNFRGGAPVAMRLRGKLQRGTARIIDDPALIERVVRRMVQERGEGMAQRMGFLAPDASGTLQPHAPRGTTFIEIEPSEAVG